MLQVINPLLLSRDRTWIGRLAPTPSGFLHPGNAVNFLITWSVLRALGGQVGLRIDDMDTSRVRLAYIQDIFDVLHWLGLDWDFGPKDAQDHAQNYGFSHQQDAIYHWAEQLIQQHHAFACGCSRRDLQCRGLGEVYDGQCQNLALSFIPGQMTLRFAQAATPQNPLGQAIIWRKDHAPSYHLASVFADVHGGINLLVRGADLYPSSRLQLHLAKALQQPQYHQAWHFHHGLITNSQGIKLSKSTQNQGQSLCQGGLSPQALYQQAAKILKCDPRDIYSPPDLVLALHDRMATSHMADQLQS